jgi:hypothetical protein
MERAVGGEWSVGLLALAATDGADAIGRGPGNFRAGYDIWVTIPSE